MPVLPDIDPLRRHRDFRVLYFGQFVSLLGSMLSYVALPYALFQLTHSPKLLGLLGVIQLVPSVVGDVKIVHALYPRDSATRRISLQPAASTIGDRESTNPESLSGSHTSAHE